MTNEEKIRAEFEEWVQVNLYTKNGGFSQEEINKAWKVWQAALTTHPDVNQELVEALERYGSCLVSCASVPFTNKDCTCGFKQVLAKHKAGESVGFTKEELIKIVSTELAETEASQIGVEDCKKWAEEFYYQFLGQSFHVITALKQCGALKVKGE